MTRISVFLVLLAAFTISAGKPFEGAKPEVAKSASTSLPQDDYVVMKGTVKDNTGFPLPGVSVRVKGTTTGAATDIDGNFEFRVPNSKGLVLVFSFIGMKDQEIAYKGQASFNVTLEDETTVLDDVIVTGYQKIDRRLFTGSADVVKAEDLKTDGANDVSRMLQGKSAGVQVQNVSGTFGAAPKMRVRGASSIHGDQKPLWVVDGIVQEDVVDVSADDLSSGDAATLISSAVAGLNSDDIESFQILKDASATALYGARAMNGVVVITTKRGKAGSVRVNYSGEFTMRLKPSYNSYNLMNSQEQMRAYLDMEEKGWLNYTDVMRGANGGVYHKMYTALDNYTPGQGFEIPHTTEGKHEYLKRFEKVNTDWFDALFKNSLQHSHSVSITAGTQKARFFASLSYFGDPGWSVADKVDRYTANMNASFDINKYITFHLLTSNSFRKQEAPGATSQATDAVTGIVSRDFDINPFSYALNTSRAMRVKDEDGNPEYYVRNFAPFNIFNELKNNYLELDMLDTKFQGELEIKPMTGWDIRLLGAVRYVKSSREHHITENSNQAEAYRAAYDATMRSSNQYLYSDPDHPGMPKEIVLPQGGFYKRTDNRLLNYYFRAITNYMKSINDIHLFNVTAGMEVKSTERRETFQTGFGIQYDRGNVPYIDYRIIKQLLERGEDFYGINNGYERFVAFFITGGYSFNEKYTLNLTGRYDGSNRMGESMSSRWLPTWNVSGAWHVHNEEFFKPVKSVLSNMTLRATYGLTANMGPATNAKAIFNSSVTFRPSQSDRENEIYITTLGNSDLTWEKQHEFNVGLDLGLLNNKISFSTDYYVRRGFDLIGTLRTMGIGGQGSKLANYANMKSSGVEFSLNTKNITTNKFSWTTNVTFSYSTNEITKLRTSARVVDLTAISGYPMQGRPVRGAYSIPFKGLNESGLPTYEVMDSDGKMITTVDEVNFQDRTYHQQYMKYEGSMDPKYTGGMDNTFKYGPFRLSAFLTYQFGNKVWLYDYFRATYSDLTAMPKEFSNRWMVPGDEKHTKIPVFVSKRQMSDADYNYNVAYNAYNKSTERVAKGDFIRLKELSLSYDVPKEFVNSISLQSVSFRFSASNLWLIYSDKKLKGEDPEFARSGGVSMPVPKQFTLSVKIGF
ncbi:SusC/RagA family TonB-linked outer membrane protein [Porphyromonadaceae bacterium OttesenSCG-928-L07]|nr:SusC/RagA family TonB-linked outer membrane protein [Porphyromonadaceae bacterium OttesenSCG-928-L07]